MKCYCYETDSKIVYCVEDVDNVNLEDAILHKGWVKNSDKFLFSLPRHVFTNSDIELMKDNFPRLGQAMFESEWLGFDWRKPIEFLAQLFRENQIEWYLIGSASDALRGVKVKPGDIDIVVHTKDYAKAKHVFDTALRDSITMPIIDYKGLMPLQYMGKIFLNGALIEMGGDEKWNRGNRKPQYESVSWYGYDIYLEAFQLRHQIEIARNRQDRLKAIEEYIAQGEKLHEQA